MILIIFSLSCLNYVTHSERQHVIMWIYVIFTRGRLMFKLVSGKVTFHNYSEAREPNDHLTVSGQPHSTAWACTGGVRYKLCTLTTSVLQ